MTIQSYLHATLLDRNEGVLFEPIPDRLASSICGGSSGYETNQRRCVNGDCLYKEKRVEDGEVVHQYTGDEPPWKRLFALDLHIDDFFLS